MMEALVDFDFWVDREGNQPRFFNLVAQPALWEKMIGSQKGNPPLEEIRGRLEKGVIVENWSL